MDPVVDFNEKEKQIILREYKGLMRMCMEYTKEERKLIRRTFEYSLNAHKGARRKSGEPYFLHPIAVAKICIKEMGLGPTSVVCALLHDVVEDTFAEIHDIKMEFGSVVAKIIDGLTKISGVFDHKSSAQAENFRKMLLTLSDDIRVILIKLADRLHNMQTLQYMKKESQLKIASETLYLYAPLANRLGIHKIKSELEDLALRYTEPTLYAQIQSKLTKSERESRYYISTFMKNIKEKLKVSKLKFNIISRFKSIHSIYTKIKRQGIPFDEIYDLFAIRVILDSKPENEKADCFKAYSIISELYRSHPERMRDWISMPKANGYESLHMTVMGPKGKWIEVQIRTERMDEVAEQGIAAHWKYKDDGALEDEQFEKWLGNVRELLKNPNMNAVDVVREFKTNLATEEVFVFTPAGDLIKLPKPSTVLDFAYEIHSNLGDSCIGAKVNSKVVPLSYTLNNGDQVEIISSKTQKPKEEWLQFAHTSKAKHKIKDSIKREKHEIAEKGREIFNWKASKFGFSEHDPVLKELLAFFKIPSKKEFFYLLGHHLIDLKKIQEFITIKQKGGEIKIEPPADERERITDRKDFEGWLKKNKGMDSDMLMVGSDMSISDYKFAPCCQPIPGDDIIGFFSPDEGVTIHRSNCTNAQALMSNWGRNIIKAKWNEIADIMFLAGIKIVGEDRQGMMNDMIKVISNTMKLNIRSITIDSNDGMFEGVFKVFIRSTKDIDKLSVRLKEVRGVFSVTRVE